MAQHHVPTVVQHRREPALADLLADPIVVALMQADGVGRTDLEASLHGVARALPPRRGRRPRNIVMKGRPS